MASTRLTVDEHGDGLVGVVPDGHVLCMIRFSDESGASEVGDALECTSVHVGADVEVRPRPHRDVGGQEGLVERSRARPQHVGRDAVTGLKEHLALDAVVVWLRHYSVGRQ
jgi:hypothetical protein